jgi:hypothetical protein
VAMAVANDSRNVTTYRPEHVVNRADRAPVAVGPQQRFDNEGCEAVTNQASFTTGPLVPVVAGGSDMRSPRSLDGVARWAGMKCRAVESICSGLTMQLRKTVIDPAKRQEYRIRCPQSLQLGLLTSDESPPRAGRRLAKEIKP